MLGAGLRTATQWETMVSPAPTCSWPEEVWGVRVARPGQQHGHCFQGHRDTAPRLEQDVLGRLQGGLWLA